MRRELRTARSRYRGWAGCAARAGEEGACDSCRRSSGQGTPAQEMNHASSRTQAREREMYQHLRRDLGDNSPRAVRTGPAPGCTAAFDLVPACRSTPAGHTPAARIARDRNPSDGVQTPAQPGTRSVRSCRIAAVPRCCVELGLADSAPVPVWRRSTRCVQRPCYFHLSLHHRLPSCQSRPLPGWTPHHLQSQNSSRDQ